MAIKDKDVGTEDGVGDIYLAKDIIVGGIKSRQLMQNGTKENDMLLMGSSYSGKEWNGGSGSDLFVFNQIVDEHKRKKVETSKSFDGYIDKNDDLLNSLDKLDDFSSKQNDKLVFDRSVFKKSRKLIASNSGIKHPDTNPHKFVFENKVLFYNDNGAERGWGENGGFVAYLPDTDNLTNQDFVFF